LWSWGAGLETWLKDDIQEGGNAINAGYWLSVIAIERLVVLDTDFLALGNEFSQ
jgi:hypothetical protein